jgi:hypothetical protein
VVGCSLRNEFFRRLLGISVADLDHIVTTQWTTYFNELGATKTAVALADAVPGVQAIAPQN